MGASYELKYFKSSQSRDFTKALNLYSQNIESTLRTDTREISHWLDEYPSRFKDKFMVLGLYLNSELIGYAQLAYFIEEKIVFVDYIALAKEKRKNNTFYEFVEEIREYLLTKDIEYDFILAEVGGFEGNEPAQQTKNLIRLLKMSGFGVVKTNYYHPRLGKNKFESEFQSVLMMYSPDELKSIKKETFFLFLNTIYFKHYKRWYDDFFNEIEKADYGRSLIRLVERSVEDLKKKERVEINGYLNIYTTQLPASSPKSYRPLSKLAAIFVLFTLICTGFGLLHLFIKDKLGVETNAQAYIAIASGFLLIFVLLVRRESKQESITTIIEKTIEKFS